MNDRADILRDLQSEFGAAIVAQQPACDSIPTVWVLREQANGVLRFLKSAVERPYRMLYDLTAIDERVRVQRQGQPDSDFTVVYHLLSFERNQDIRIKVALKGEYPSIGTITDLWPAADWYEREAWDMFGITFDGHPHLSRILMPATWEGHPLRKEHPARATEMEPFRLPDDRREKEEAALQFRPEE